METQVGTSKVELIIGDITLQQTDAIVNAANCSLLGGGGVDGAIHRAAGPELLAACRLLGGCSTGESRVTEGFNLEAQWIVHAVGPIYGLSDDDVGLLHGAYWSSLCHASEGEMRSIAFPAISTGVYGYPVNEAADISLGAAIDYLTTMPHKIDLVRFVLFDQKTYDIFEKTLKDLRVK